MTNNKRKLSILLSALLILSALSSCGGDSGSSDTTASSGDVTTAPVTEETARAIDSLPEKDFEGAQFNILIRNEVDYEFNAEQTGEIVNDAVFARNQSVGERFNLTINYISVPGLWPSKNEYQNLITQAVLAGDSTYDVVTGQSNIIMPLAVQKLYNELQDSQYIDFDQPYWKDGYTDNVKINGTMYTLCGDFALTTLDRSNVIFFNKGLVDIYELDDPYELVRTGAWTIDRFTEMAKTVSSDLNGDTKFDANDQYGFSGFNNTVAPFLSSLGCALTSVGDDGRRVVDFPSERDIEAFDKVYALCHDQCYVDTEKKLFPIEGDMFESGLVLFLGQTLNTVETMRDFNIDFGIVPYPKLNEDQEDYRVSILRTFTLAAIPITARDSEMSEIVLEAMACDGYNNIVPAYYEIALKGKYARDEETVEMLDIISTSSWFDFTDCYYSDLGAISDFMANYARGNSEGLVSLFESRKSTLETQLEALYESYEKD